MSKNFKSEFKNELVLASKQFVELKSGISVEDLRFAISIIDKLNNITLPETITSVSKDVQFKQTALLEVPETKPIVKTAGRGIKQSGIDKSDMIAFFKEMIKNGYVGKRHFYETFEKRYSHKFTSFDKSQRQGFSTPQWKNKWYNFFNTLRNQQIIEKLELDSANYILVEWNKDKDWDLDKIVAQI
jgi:hypothetical protein